MVRDKKIKRECRSGRHWCNVGMIALCLFLAHCSANVVKDDGFHAYCVTFIDRTTFEGNVLIELSDSLDRAYIVVSPRQDQLSCNEESNMDSLKWGGCYSLKILPSTVGAIKKKDYGVTIRQHGPGIPFYIGKTIVWSKDTMRVPVYSSDDIHGVCVEKSRILER